jgi:hypothetical protein
LAASILGACAAGTLAAVTTHPIDTAKTCLQSDMDGVKYKSTFGTMKQLVQSGGIGSLYRGMMPRTVRLCGAFFVCLMVRDAAIEWKTQHANQQEVQSLVGTIHIAKDTSGVVTATSPTDSK